MDIDALHSTLLTVALVSEKLGKISRTLDPHSDCGLIQESLREAESDLRVARATLANELGFKSCPRCWPPELLTIDRQGTEVCPACGQHVYERAGVRESIAGDVVEALVPSA